MKNKYNPATVAYCIKDVEKDAFILKKDCYYEVSQKQGKHSVKLKGLWNGGTFMLDTVDLINIDVDKHFIFYDMPERCIKCKYGHCNENGPRCTSGYCVQEDD